MKTIYEKKYNYSQVKAICELFKYRNELQELWGVCDYEDIIKLALEYYEEWTKIVDYKKGKRKTPIVNKIGNEINFISEEEFAYEQAYFDRRIKEDYLL